MKQRIFFLFVLTLFSCPSIAEDANLEAQKYIDQGLRNFTPCYLNTNNLLSDCKTGCGQRCTLELQEQLGQQVLTECNKICSEHCDKVISQAGSQKCDLGTSLSSFNKALSYQPNNPGIWINLAYVKIALAKQEAQTKSNKSLVLKYLEDAEKDALKSKQLYSSINDEAGIPLSENALLVIKQNKENYK